ncbi:MAG: radical SAM protein [Oscillospiraceae bacterium]|nr:radical SAM protein [Oscillospiraceae bacterium]
MRLNHITSEEISTPSCILNPEDVRGKIHHRDTGGMVDGPGIRYVVFMQGCPLRCLYCHNPGSQSEGGEEWTAKDLVKEIVKYKNFLSGGVTFSGGEPLLQHEFIYACAQLLKKHGISIAIDTAGIPQPELAGKAIDSAELLLLDIKAHSDELALALTGCDNSRGFATLEYCEKTGKDVWLRHVLLMGYTLEENALKTLAKRLKPYTCIKRVELLPFHKMGETKWAGMDYKLTDTPATTKAQQEWAAKIFARYGLVE